MIDTLKIARRLIAGTGGFISDYNSGTYPHPMDRSMRVWSYSRDGENLPLVMTDIIQKNWDGRDVIWLKAIISPEKQGTGIASHVIQNITKMADRHGVPIYITPKPFGTVKNQLSKGQLVSWYRRNGWENSRGGVMIREPR